jgi:hypothetical protein
VFNELIIEVLMTRNKKHTVRSLNNKPKIKDANDHYLNKINLGMIKRKLGDIRSKEFSKFSNPNLYFDRDTHE